MANHLHAPLCPPPAQLALYHCSDVFIVSIKDLLSLLSLEPWNMLLLGSEKPKFLCHHPTV